MKASHRVLHASSLDKLGMKKRTRKHFSRQSQEIGNV